MSRPLQCPHPEKRAFDTGLLAVRFAEQVVERLGVPQFAYECRCGSWHLTKTPTPGSTCPTCGTVQS